VKYEIAAMDFEPEHPNFTLYNMHDPEIQTDSLFNQPAASIPRP
jgi:hypothetical protein